jgi:hypothetical protein
LFKIPYLDKEGGASRPSERIDGDFRSMKRGEKGPEINEFRGPEPISDELMTPEV